MNLLRTDSSNEDFKSLVTLLDQELAVLDGEEHSFYNQLNKIDHIKHALVYYEGGSPAGCGAIREYEPGVMEVKRMYTRPELRGKGIASIILNELENWTAEMGYEKCILETGKRQPDAIHLYEKNHYIQIPNYGKYIGIENSVCFEKKMNQSAPQQSSSV